MRKNLLIMIVLCLFFASCEKEMDEITNESSTDLADASNGSRVKSYGDGKYDMLGYGFDPTEGHLSPIGEGKQVINTEKFKMERPHDWQEQNLYRSDGKLYYGASAEDISVKLKYKYSASFTKVLTLGMKAEGEINQKISRNYAHATYYFRRTLKHYKYITSLSTLRNYLTSGFENDINSMTYNEIIKYYGTHVYTDVYLGGVLEATYKSKVIKSDKSLTVKSGISAGIEKVFSVSSDLEGSYTLAENNTDVTFEYVSRGGVGTFSGVITSDQKDLSAGLQSFISSVNVDNSVCIDVGDQSCIPIYEFLSDPIKKNGLKVAVEAYLASKEYLLVDDNLESIGSSSSKTKFYFADVNGDGKDDKIYWKYDKYGGNVRVALMGNNNEFGSYIASDGSSSSSTQIYFADVNGDGKADKIYRKYNKYGGDVRVALSTGNGHFNSYIRSSGSSSSSTKFYFADVNGDGKCDKIYWRNSRHGGDLRVALSRGNGTFNSYIHSSGSSSSDTKFYFADVNGDGKSDKIYWRYSRHGGDVRVALSNGNGSFSSYIHSSGSSSSKTKFYFPDKNNDGKADKIYWKYDKYGGDMRVAHASGQGAFNLGYDHLTASSSSKTKFYFADINGDGRDDKIYWKYDKYGGFLKMNLMFK